MKALKPDEKVPVSGTYRVLHLLPHSAEQRELYFEGSLFPACQVCAAGVRYRLESPFVPMSAVPMTQLAMSVC
jgi:hypothetical protein